MNKNKRQRQLLSNKQFVVAIVLVIAVVVFLYSLALIFSNTYSAGNGEFRLQLSDIISILIFNGVLYGPYIFIPAAVISFLYLSSKKSKNLRWPVTLLSLGLLCLVISLLFSFLSALF